MVTQSGRIQQFGHGRDPVVGVVEVPRSVAEHGALDFGEPPHLVLIPGAEGTILYQLQHGGQGGASDGRGRIGGDPPVIGSNDDGLPHDRPVGGQVLGGHPASGCCHVLGEPAADASGVEGSRPFGGEGAQAGRQTLDPHDVPLADQRTVGVMQRRKGLREPIENRLGGVNEIGSRRRREWEPFIGSANRRVEDRRPIEGSVPGRGFSQACEGPGGGHGSMADERGHASPVSHVDLVPEPRDRAVGEAPARHLGVPVDHERIPVRRPDGDEGAGAGGDDAGIGGHGGHGGSDGGVDGVTTPIGHLGTGFGGDRRTGGDDHPQHRWGG